MTRQTAGSIVRKASPALVLIACLLPYWNALDNGFTYDDHYVVAGNDLVRSLDVVRIFGSPFWEGFTTAGAGTYYRPLTILTYAIDHALAGLRPGFFHLTNLILHAAASMLVLLLTRRLVRSDRAALAAGLIFAVHPVHTEAVSSIAGRSDILVTLFGTAALLCHLSRRALLRAAVAPLVLLALCSKEIALVVPGLLVVCDLVWPGSAGQSRSERIRRLGSRHAGSAAAVVAFLALRWVAVGSGSVPPSPLDNPLVDHGAAAALFTLPAILAHYARLLVYPVSLSVDYGFNQIPVATSPGPGFVLVLAAVGLAVAYVRRGGRVSPTGTVAGAILMFPILAAANPVMVSGSMLSERYLYLPSVGFVLLLAASAHRFRPAWADDRSRRIVASVLVAAAVLAGGLRVVDRNRDWQDDRHLFAAAVDVTPNSVRARLNYAEILASSGDHASAVPHYAHVLGIKPDYPIVNLKMARALQGAGQPEAAVTYYETTTRLSPGLAEAWTGLGSLAIRLGRDQDAERAIRAAIALTPGNAFLYIQLGVIYQRRGEPTKAIEAYERALAGDYRHPGVYCNLGVIYRSAGDLDAARAMFDTALDLAPDMPLPHYHMGGIETDAGNRPEAIAHFERFLETWDRDEGVADRVRQNLRRLRSSS